MKKIISIFISAILVMTPFITNAAEEDGLFDTILNGLAEYTPAERESLIAYTMPFITTDIGVDAAISNIQAGTMSGIFTGLFGGKADNDTLIRMFRSFSCIKDETEIRIQYGEILQDKIELDNASNSTISGIQKLLDAVFEKSPAAEKIFTEDGYSAEVVANLLTIIPKINGGEPMIRYENGVFEIDTIDQTFKDDFDAVWDGYVSGSGSTITYQKLVERLVGFLNDNIPQGDKSSVATALRNLDICEKASSSNGTGGGNGSGGNGSGSGTNGSNSTDDGKTEDTKPTVDETSDYTVLDSYDGITDAMLGGGFIIEIKTDANAVVEIETQASNPMVYLYQDGGLLPVKYSVLSEKGITAQVEPGEVYVVKSSSYPFTDANGWGKSYISALYNRGIINGKSETTFEPDASITREEFVKLVVELFGLNDTSLTVDFQDVQEGSWYYSYVASAYKNGIVSGIGDNLFGTGQNIKRQDMAKIINTVLAANGIEGEKADSSVLVDFDSISDYARDDVLAIFGLGIISGDDNGNFNPNQFATRQEAAKMVYGMLTAYVSSLAG